jgi:DNA-binding transcriptional LysR family regulator
VDLELRHLKVVCAVAETGSVTKAAARLGLAQPALTAQLNRIERTLGGPLFERDRRGARPTQLGELVLARARVVLPAVEGLREEVARLAGAMQGSTSIRIGSVGNSMAGGLVSRLQEEQPDANVITTTSWSAEELATMVAGNKLDFAVVGVCGDAPPPSTHGLEWRVVAIDAIGVLVPASHPSAGGEEINLADLAEERWAATPGDGCFGDCFAAACARAGFTPKPMYETDVRDCIDLVEAGRAVVLCRPTWREFPGIRALPFAGAPLRWRHVLGWHPESPAAAIADQVHAHAVGAYQDSLLHNPRYAAWLTEHPRFGTSVMA